jgi:hypothetical protein
MKVYCISCGAANDWITGSKPTVCAKCKKSVNGSDAAIPAPVAKPKVPSLAELLSRQNRAKPAITASFIEDDENEGEDENSFGVDLDQLDAKDIGFKLELDKPNSVTLGEAISAAAPPPPKVKGVKISKTARKQSMKAMLNSQKSSRGKS